MNISRKKGMISTLVFALCVMASATVSAHGGWRGGGGGWHDGGWHGGGWYGGAVIIGAPAYYDYGCQTVRVCNSNGHCWLQQGCY